MKTNKTYFRNFLTPRNAIKALEYHLYFRIVSDHGVAGRCPYLDENVVSFLNSLPINVKMNMQLERGLLTPSEANASDNTGSNMSPVIESKPNFISTESSELLNRISTGGLQLLYRYTRLPYIYSPQMTAIELSFTNQGMNFFIQRY